MGHENGGAFNDDQKGGHDEPPTPRPLLEDRYLTDDEVRWMLDQKEKLDAAMDRLAAEVSEHRDDRCACCEDPTPADDPAFYLAPWCGRCGHPGGQHAGAPPQAQEPGRDDELVCQRCGRPFALHGIECETTSRAEPMGKPVENVFGSGSQDPLGGYPGVESDFMAAVPPHLQGVVEPEDYAGEVAEARQILRCDRPTPDPNPDSAEWYACRDIEPDESLWCERCKKPADQGPQFGLVEELRFTAIVGLLDDEDTAPRDIVDAEDLLDRLPAIFGAREVITVTPGPRIVLGLSVVDLRGIPEGLLWGEGREYRRVLDQTTEAGWSWLNSTGCDSRLVGIGMLKAVPS